MNSISAINQTSNTQSRWQYFRDLASVVCSRESTYRGALDVTGLDLPVIFSDLFRSYKKTLESIFEGITGTTMVVVAPILTTFVGKFLARSILPKEMQRDAIHYLKFSMSDLKDFEKFKVATDRIKSEEVEDKNFIAALHTKTGRTETAEKYKEEAKEIEDFCNSFTPTEEKQKLIYKLKKATIIGESFIEGCYWGSFGLIIRLFRKHILREERFTGTMNYASSEESATLGEAEELSSFQKLAGIGSIFISPIVNAVLLTKTEDKEAVKNSKFLQVVDNQFDMTHGVYPKLGLLFSMTSFPKWIGTIIMSQGWFERVERILKLLTVIPSWWLGHRATNGLFALSADKKFAKKYETAPGTLIEPAYLNKTNENTSILNRLDKTFPEPARIHHILKSLSEKEEAELNQAKDENIAKEIKTKYTEIRNEAEDLHAKCLYKGFGMHSFLVWGINMVVNQITKLRVLSALGK